MKKLGVRSVLLAGALITAALACNFSPESSSDDRNATVQALSTSVAATSTALIQESQVTPQNSPSEIPPSPTFPPQQQIQVTEDLQATQEFANAMIATQTALAPYTADLVKYGVDPQKGQMAWVQDGLSMEVDQYRGSKFDNKFPQVIAQDFVLSADITWDTEYGAAGCAFVFRSDGNQSAPNQYMVWMTRLTNGRVEFAVFSQGQIIGGKDFYANGVDPSFDGQNGATNQLAVVAKGYDFEVYTNGVKIGDADPNVPPPPLVLPDPPEEPNSNNPQVIAAYQRELAIYRETVSRLKREYDARVALWKKAEKEFPAGIVAMGAVADSGRTYCEFNNAWLWLMAP